MTKIIQTQKCEATRFNHLYNYLLLIALVSLGVELRAQNPKVTITDDISDIGNLCIRPYISIIIPPLDIKTKDALPATLNLDAQYWYKEVADVRVGLNLGSFMGGTLGATYHLKDKVKPVNHKFVTSRTTKGKIETTTYFKAEGNSRKIFGPSLDVTLGGFKVNGASGVELAFYNRIDFGVDFQQFSRVHAKTGQGTFKSSKNGWTSFKVQGVFATGQKKVGLGAAATVQATVSPWKSVSLYAGLPMGIMKLVKGVDTSSVLEPTTITPIFAINLGASITL